MITVLIVYFDDMIVTGNDDLEITALQDYLATEFEMKDLGLLRHFLGIEVVRSTLGCSLVKEIMFLICLQKLGCL